MSTTTITHWATPLHSIPPPSHDTIVSSRLKLLQEERECKNQQSKTIEVPTSTSSVSVSIPRTGLYGFILGQDNFNGKTAIDGQISFESKILNKDGESSATSNVATNVNCNNSSRRNGSINNNNNNDNNNNNNNNRNKKSKRKKDKLLNSLPTHCGCTFRATFQSCASNSITVQNDDDDNNKNNTSTNSSSCSIILPMTSQLIDPTICSISLDEKEGKDTDVDVDVDVDTNESGNQGKEKISYPMRVITSTLVARLIYIRKGTNISIEYVNCCTDDDNTKKKNNDRDHCCDKSWKWGLFLHRFVGWEVENSDDNNNNVNHNSNDTSISDRQKQEKEMDIEMGDTKNISTASDDGIQLPEEKRARCSTRNTNQKQKQPQASSKIDKITKNNNPMVNFFPEEARKKPLLCSTCYKKFPTASAIYKHAIVWHLETIAKKGSQEYINLVGPPVVHKPLHAAYDDDDIVVVVKHQGLSVMGERWTLSKSDLLLPFRRLVNKPQDVPVKGKNDGKVIVNDTLSKPRAAHRLDSATGGLLVVTKTHTSEISMKKCFMNRTCQKRYRAILFGRLEGVSLQSSLSSSSQNILSNYDKISKDDISLTTGIIDSPIGGKESMTYYSVVSYTRCSNVLAKGWITTVDLYPVTGRNHQLRKHMKLVGHPMWGDKRYGPYGKKDASFSQTEEANDTTTNVDLESMIATQNPHSKLCLWALEITFPHPIHGKELNVKIDEPNWYRELRDDQEKKWKCLQS